MARLFLSHATPDSRLASRLYADLQAAGHEVVMDLYQLELGHDAVDFMNREVESADAVVVLHSRHTAAARWQGKEINAALWLETAHGTPRVIVLRADDSRIPALLGSKVYGDLQGVSYRKTVERLCTGLALAPGVPEAVEGERAADGPARRRAPARAGDLEALEAALAARNASVLQSRSYARHSAELYFERSDARVSLRELLAGDKVVMVLTGKAGTGKSSFVASLPGSLPPGTLLWLQDCGQLDLPRGRRIERLVLDSLPPSLRRLERLADCLERAERTMLLVFDGLNELGRREELVAELAGLVRAISSPRLKVLLTCRVPAWNVLRRHFAVPAGKELRAGGFTGLDLFLDSEIEQAYEPYRRAYRIATPYARLSAQVRYFLAHPLFLRLTCESFAGREIPQSLALHEVFAAYVRKCLGEEALRSREYEVLERAVVLMYEHARRELEVELLRRDERVGGDVAAGLDSPYGRLLDEGLLSEATRHESLLRTVDVVFVTYERVFEFLLAEIVVGSVTAEEIVHHLEVIREKSFLQLRGALDLALSFALLGGTADASLLIDLARIDRPDSRQFLSDVIQTIFESGHREKAAEILALLTEDSALESKLLAAQVAYQLALDESLLELVLASEAVLRDRAALYLYEHWNRGRLAGDLAAAYRPLERLRSMVNLRRPRQSVRALSALMSLCVNMGMHVIDDPAALGPLIEILQGLVRGVPGLAPDPGRSGIVRFVSDGTAGVIIETLAELLSRVMIKRRVLGDIFADAKAQRALLDVGSLITLPGLRGYEQKVIRLLRWDHPTIAFSSRSVLTRHVYLKPAEHLAMFQGFLEDDSLPLLVRINVLHSMVFGTVARLMRQERVAGETLELFARLLEELWLETMAPEAQGGKPGERDDVLEALRHALFGIFFIEATAKRLSGAGGGSRLWERLCRNEPGDQERQIELVLGALERIAYQGFVDFAVETLGDRRFSALWERKVPVAGYRALANVRAVFQEEVDGILQEDEQSRKLWDKVRLQGGAPNPGDLWEMSYSLWTMIGTAVNVTMMKLSGLILLELVHSKSPAEFLRRTLRTLLAVLFDPERIDVAHVQYGLAHDPEWDLFEALEIPREVVGIKPEVHAYYRKVTRKCVARLGRGILYDEL